MATDTTLPDEVQSERPLTATQVRNLEKLVRNDFNTVYEEITRFYTDKFKTEKAALELEASEQLKDELIEKGKKAALTYQRVSTRLQNEARKAGLEFKIPGLTFNMSPGYSNSIEVTDLALQKRLRELRKKIDAEQEEVISIWRVKLNEAERAVFLSGISNNAEKLLASIPTASDLMSAGVKELNS